MNASNPFRRLNGILTFTLAVLVFPTQSFADDLEKLGIEIPHAITESPYRNMQMAEVYEFFSQAKFDPGLPWNYLEGGCEDKALILCHRLLARGIKVAKIWIGSKSSNSKVRLSSGYPEWNYHVAVIVWVTLALGGQGQMVIDPAISPKPLRVSDWMALMHFLAKGSASWEPVTSHHLEVTQCQEVLFDSEKPLQHERFVFDQDDLLLEDSKLNLELINLELELENEEAAKLFRIDLKNSTHAESEKEDEGESKSIPSSSPCEKCTVL